MNVVFFGGSKFVLPILEVLKKKHHLALILTTDKQGSDPVPQFAKQNDIEYICISNFSDLKIEQKIAASSAPLAVLAYFGLIVPEHILRLFPKGIINIHPSLLPKYRGPTPVQSAILAGDNETGVTIIKLDSEVDHGPILAQKKEPIYPNDTTETLHERLFTIGAGMFEDILEPYIEGDLSPKQQNHKEAIFTKHLTRESGFFDSANPPDTETLDRMIRAYYPWPGAWAKIRIKNLPAGRQGDELRIKLLPARHASQLAGVAGRPDQKIQIEGKRPMSYKDFFNGYPEARDFMQQVLGWPRP